MYQPCISHRSSRCRLTEWAKSLQMVWNAMQAWWVSSATSHLQPRGCEWRHMSGNVSVACLLETTWQADILQINEERLSISSGIRHSLKRCVISVPTVSIFSGAENLLWATRVHGRRLRKRRTREIASKRCAFGRAMSANRPGSFLCLHAFLFLLPAGSQLGKSVTYENAYHSFHGLLSCNFS